MISLSIKAAKYCSFWITPLSTLLTKPQNSQMSSSVTSLPIWHQYYSHLMQASFAAWKPFHGNLRYLPCSIWWKTLPFMHQNLEKKMFWKLMKFIEKSGTLSNLNIQKCFVKCGFTATEVVQQQDMTEILQQEQELASLAQRIGVDSSRISVEENLQESENKSEETLIEQLVEEYRRCKWRRSGGIRRWDWRQWAGTAESDYMSQAKKMVMIWSLCKGQVTIQRKMDLLAIKATIQSLYFSTLQPTYFQLIINFNKPKWFHQYLKLGQVIPYNPHHKVQKRNNLELIGCTLYGGSTVRYKSVQPRSCILCTWKL